MEAEEIIFTLKEASDFLRVSTQTMTKLIKAGEIPGKKVKGQWRIRKADILAWFDDAPKPMKGGESQ